MVVDVSMNASRSAIPAIHGSMTSLPAEQVRTSAPLFVNRDLPTPAFSKHGDREFALEKLSVMNIWKEFALDGETGSRLRSDSDIGPSLSFSRLLFSWVREG